jgi:hypothetical protein
MQVENQRKQKNARDLATMSDKVGSSLPSLPMLKPERLVLSNARSAVIWPEKKFDYPLPSNARKESRWSEHIWFTLAGLTWTIGYLMMIFHVLFTRASIWPVISASYSIVWEFSYVMTSYKAYRLHGKNTQLARIIVFLSWGMLDAILTLASIQYGFTAQVNLDELGLLPVESASDRLQTWLIYTITFTLITVFFYQLGYDAWYKHASFPIVTLLFFAQLRLPTVHDALQSWHAKDVFVYGYFACTVSSHVLFVWAKRQKSASLQPKWLHDAYVFQLPIINVWQGWDRERIYQWDQKAFSTMFSLVFIALCIAGPLSQRLSHSKLT